MLHISQGRENGTATQRGSPAEVNLWVLMSPWEHEAVFISPGPANSSCTAMLDSKLEEGKQGQ